MPDVSTEVAIATTTLGTAANTISFSSIPATYTDLRIVLAASGVTTSGNTVTMTMNNDAANFGSTWLLGNPAVGSGSSGRATNSFGRLSGDSGIAGTGPFLVTADIFSYRGSQQKTTLAEFYNDNNGSGVLTRTVNLFLSTAAITQISLVCAGTFSIGTTATLYGIL